MQKKTPFSCFCRCLDRERFLHDLMNDVHFIINIVSFDCLILLFDINCFITCWSSYTANLCVVILDVHCLSSLT